MFKKKCSLCGGELSRGICQECGLDNNKKRMQQIDDMGHSSTGRYGQSSSQNWETTSNTRSGSGSDISNEEFFSKWKKEQLDMEHEDVYHRGEQIDYSKPKKWENRPIPNQQPNRQPHQPVMTSQPRKKSPLIRMLTIIFVIYFIMNIIGAVLTTVFSSGIFDSMSEYIDLEESDWESDGDEYEWENTIEYPDSSEYPIVLDETGESYTTTLTAGIYVVGVHIPEGTYSIECVYTGMIIVDDIENMMYFSNYYMDENIGEIDEGITLYEGAMIEITDTAIFELVSENANTEGMTAMENPNTEALQCTGVVVAGIDFAPGIYDLSVPEDSFSIVGLYSDIELVGQDDEYPVVQVFLANTDYEDSGEPQASSFKNVVIPEGYVIVVDEENLAEGFVEYVELTPSEVIENEEYESYYEEYFYY